jgi:hypothetical protein
VRVTTGGGGAPTLAGMVTSRRRAAAGLFVVALLAGCSGDGDGDAPEATQEGADAGVVTWADGVCAATTELEGAVEQVTAALQVDPAAPASALEQAKTEVAERAGEVRGAADGLRAAVSTSPPGVLSQEAAAAREELSATAERAGTAAEELAAQGAALAEAQTPADTAAALTAAGSALAAAGTGLQAYLAELTASVESRDPVLRDSFAEAPACQARQAGASPSS